MDNNNPYFYLNVLRVYCDFMYILVYHLKPYTLAIGLLCSVEIFIYHLSSSLAGQLNFFNMINIAEQKP